MPPEELQFADSDRIQMLQSATLGVQLLDGDGRGSTLMIGNLEGLNPRFLDGSFRENAILANHRLGFAAEYAVISPSGHHAADPLVQHMHEVEEHGGRHAAHHAKNLCLEQKSH